MRPVSVPTRAHLLVCTDGSCKQRGGDLLFRALWAGLEREGLAYYKSGGSLRLTESGCLGACQFGPAVACYFRRDGGLEEAWYAPVTYPLAAEIARALHAGEEPPGEGRF